MWCDGRRAHTCNARVEKRILVSGFCVDGRESAAESGFTLASFQLVSAHLSHMVVRRASSYQSESYRRLTNVMRGWLCSCCITSWTCSSSASTTPSASSMSSSTSPSAIFAMECAQSISRHSESRFFPRWKSCSGTNGRACATAELTLRCERAASACTPACTGEHTNRIPASVVVTRVLWCCRGQLSQEAWKLVWKRAADSIARGLNVGRCARAGVRAGVRACGHSRAGVSWFLSGSGSVCLCDQVPSGNAGGS